VKGAAYLLVAAAVKVANYPFAIFLSKDTVVDRRQAGTRDAGLLLLSALGVRPLVHRVVLRVVVRAVTVFLRRLHFVLLVEDGVGVLSRKLSERGRGDGPVLLVVSCTMIAIQERIGNHGRAEI
jgi:hypothetical protein